jgi:Fur family ferric uptake transcriptional regulator
MRFDPVDTLRSHRMPVTAQRLAVLRAVNGRPHATADEVATAATKDIGTISRQSVYDTLAAMVERGVLRKIQPIGSVARYEDRVGDNHHHVVCRECGMVADVDCAVGHRPCLHASQTHGFVIDEADVSYWGTCPTCAGTSRRNTGTSRRNAGASRRMNRKAVGTSRRSSRSTANKKSRTSTPNKKGK